MDHEGLAADLAKAERGEQTRLDAVQLDCARGVHEELERAQLGRDVVRVAVSGHESRLDRLGEAVKHPRSSTP